MLPTAILIDAAYFLKRLPWIYPNVDQRSPHKVAQALHAMAYLHLDWKKDNSRHEPPRSLYRIFVYDCPPSEDRFITPISKIERDHGKSPVAQFRNAFHEELLKLRKVALRLGNLSGSGWAMKEKSLTALLSGEKAWSDITDKDFVPNFRQKGVDMRLGLDIASLAHKRLVDQIVLVAGDADFVPAVKYARREGIDVILDPLWQEIPPPLLHHIDAIRSVAPQPQP